MLPEKEVKYLDALVRGYYAKRDLPAGAPVQASDFYLAVPLQQAFWEWLLTDATEWGLATYEQDWLYNELEGVSQLLTNVTLANAWLRELGVTTIDLVGLQSEMCVRSSTLGARDAGFVARPLPGLHGTYPEGTHDESGPTGVTAAELSARVDAELA